MQKQPNSKTFERNGDTIFSDNSDKWKQLVARIIAYRCKLNDESDVNSLRTLKSLLEEVFVLKSTPAGAMAYFKSRSICYKHQITRC